MIRNASNMIKIISNLFRDVHFGMLQEYSVDFSRYLAIDGIFNNDHDPGIPETILKTRD